ncbi:phage shock protein A (PspA) family protein [Glycomyces sambucus]|uniref:Phage shock protein A (PspA) family protein n=1 Tax=Glycomyces sambucus TaxID=380244 RepID=A0A1G9DBH4_9ACTN|nr:PspA/IM30 family protein [Glycomyces sambucus]SDK61242.1 phage shock protein A (PspA) family protein [Glycomyces sambucus]
MSKKQSIFGRISQLVKANINDAIDNAEDPAKMLAQIERDYKNSIVDAENAIAETIGNLRLMEEDYAGDQKAAEEWGVKAKNASQKADQLRASGSTDEADKFDNLAKVALGKQIAVEKEMSDEAPLIKSQQEVVDKLKTGLGQMKDKLNELQAKRSSLAARAKTAEAQQKVNDAIGSIDVMDPLSEVSRFEDKVRREEAKVRGHQELAMSSLDSQFEALNDVSDDADVEARLAALKAG